MNGAININSITQLQEAVDALPQFVTVKTLDGEASFNMDHITEINDSRRSVTFGDGHTSFVHPSYWGKLKLAYTTYMASHAN